MWFAVFGAGILASHAPLDGLPLRIGLAIVGLLVSFVASGATAIIHMDAHYTPHLRAYLTASALTGGLWLTASLVSSSLALNTRWGPGGFVLAGTWMALAGLGTGTWPGVKLRQIGHEQDISDKAERARQQPPPPPPLPAPSSGSTTKRSSDCPDSKASCTWTSSSLAEGTSGSSSSSRPAAS
jgi:hypothetical protein